MKIDKILEKKQLISQSTGTSTNSLFINSTGIKTTDISISPVDDKTTYKKYDPDFLFEALDDLVNETFRGWYCKRFYALGKDKVLYLASRARADGKNPRTYFAKLLKEG